MKSKGKERIERVKESIPFIFSSSVFPLPGLLLQVSLTDFEPGDVGTVYVIFLPKKTAACQSVHVSSTVI